MKMKIFCIPIGSTKGTFNLPPMEFPKPNNDNIKPRPQPPGPTGGKAEGEKTVAPPAPRPPEPEPPSPPQPPDPEPPSEPQKKREGIIAVSSDKNAVLPEDIKSRRFSKDSRSKKLIKDALMANEFLNNLSTTNIDAMVEAMYHKNMPDNSFIITEGEPGSHLYVSAEGLFEVYKEGKKIGQFGPGTTFGELAILYNAKRMASIKVVKKAKVWVLDRRDFKKIMMDTVLQETEEKVKFLRGVPLLRNLHTDVLMKMSELLRVEFYMSDTKIVTQGDQGDTFYIISGGNVKITKKNPDSQSEWEVGTLGRGNYFGELALLKQDRRQATVTAMPPGVECLILDRVPFVQLLGDLPDLEKNNYLSSPKVPTQQVVKQDFDYIPRSDLDIVATLGVGGFGRVELVQYRKDKSMTFALKCLKKAYVVEQQQEEHAYNEKAVMLHCKECPFICKLFRTYRDTKYVYFLMEPCLGGDVFTVLQKHRFFDDRTAQFMTACVVEALKYLHERGFIFRDLKPENLLLDSKGYIKMIDFGFAKGVGSSGKTWTFAGTPEYVAPEIILNKGHDRAVDYWALGVLMHEFLTGRPPFRGSDHMKTYNLILKGIEAVQFPKYVQRPASHLIRRLCRAVAAERLGYQKAGVDDIKNHKWFQGFDWVALKNRTMKAPIIQPVHGPTDTSNFDKYKKNTEVPPDEMSGWDRDF